MKDVDNFKMYEVMQRMPTPYTFLYRVCIGLKIYSPFEIESRQRRDKRPSNVRTTKLNIFDKKKNLPILT